MKNLTTEKIDKIITKADELFDSLGYEQGDYEAYHTVAKTVAYLRNYIPTLEAYDADIIDKRCIELKGDDFEEIDDFSLYYVITREEKALGSQYEIQGVYKNINDARELRDNMRELALFDSVIITGGVA